jgi:hypothetical protein
MISAIGLLRTTADECERQALHTAGRVQKSELFDIAAKWHWLAGEATKLCDRAKQIENDA